MRYIDFHPVLDFVSAMGESLDDVVHVEITPNEVVFTCFVRLPENNGILSNEDGPMYVKRVYQRGTPPEQEE